MPYSERLDRALVLAAQLHRHQTRKQSNTPYLTHLLAVAAIVGENGGSEEEVIAALLHDAIEDQGGPKVRQLLLDEFGKDVTRIVDGCTDTDETPKPPWRERKEAYLRHLDEADASIRLVSIADKIHNCRSIVGELKRHGEATWSKFNGGREGSLWYYRQLANFFSRVDSGPLAEELESLVCEMERLSGVRSQ